MNPIFQVLVCSIGFTSSQWLSETIFSWPNVFFLLILVRKPHSTVYEVVSSLFALSLLHCHVCLSAVSLCDLVSSFLFHSIPFPCNYRSHFTLILSDSDNSRNCQLQDLQQTLVHKARWYSTVSSITVIFRLFFACNMEELNSSSQPFVNQTIIHVFFF